MDSSSGMFVQLLSSVSQYASHEFQSNALQMLHGVCEFDMAMWGVVSFTRNARTIYHSINLHQVPAEVLSDFGTVAYTDGVADRVLSHPDQDVAAFNLQRELTDARYVDFMAYVRRFEFNNLLYVTRPHPRPGALNFIALFRRHAAAEYTAAEVARSRELLRAAVLAGVINDTLSLKSTTSSGADSGLVRARASTSGVLLSFDGGFVDLLQRQWPQYRGPWLPEELMRALCSVRSKFLGRYVIASALAVGDTLYIVAGPNVRQIQLTPRQIEVARLVASGCSNKEIARRLLSSEKTIANHLSAIYESLGLHGAATAADATRENWKRAALIRWWMEHPGGAESVRGSAAAHSPRVAVPYGYTSSSRSE